VKIVFDLDSNVPFYKLPSDIFAALVETLPEHRMLRVKHNQLAKEIVDADVVVSYWVQPRVFQTAKSLKAIFYAIDGVGAEHLYKEVVESEVIITNSSGCRSQAIAEHAISLVLACSRRLVELSNSMDSKGWWGNSLAQDGRPPGEISGKTIGVLGLGHVGRRIAAIAKNGFGMKVLGLKRVIEGVENVEKVYPLTELNELLSKSDIVVCALPKTPSTENTISSRAFSAIKHGSIFVNISRGDLVDEEALISSIKAGRVAAAGLDVFTQEPLPSDSQLFSLPQVVTTPHAAGMTPEFWPRFARLVRDNIKAIEKGELPTNIVSKTHGY